MPKKINHPPKHLVREFLDRRTHAPDDDSPPSQEEIRCQLNWHVVPDEGKQDQQ